MSADPDRTGPSRTSPSDPGTAPAVARRALFGLADQGLYSLTNFSLAVLIAGSVGVREFGAFGALLIAYTLALGVSNALTAEVFTVVHSGAQGESVREPLRAGAGTALALGLTCSAAALGFALVGGGPIVGFLPAFAAITPGLFLQDFWRYAFFAIGKPSSALVNDLVWAVVQSSIVVALRLTGRSTVSTLLLAWGAGGLAGAFLGMVQARLAPRPLLAWRWLSIHRGLGLRFGGEWLGLYGATQAVLTIVGVIGGLAELAKLRAAWLIFGPLQGVLNGVRLSVTSVAVISRDRHPERFTRFALSLTLAISGIAVLWAVVALSLPGRIGVALLGASWFGAKDLLLPVAIGQVAAAAGLGVLTALRATRDARRTVRARTATAALTLLFGAFGALWSGALGAALGSALANLIGVLLMTRAARLALAKPTLPGREPNLDSSRYTAPDSYGV